MDGHIILVGRFLMMKKEVVPYRDRQSGQAATFNKLEFQVLTPNGTVFVQPDTRKMAGFKMETYVSPFKEMQKVVVVIDKLDTQKGITTIAGTIEALEG